MVLKSTSNGWVPGWIKNDMVFGRCCFLAHKCQNPTRCHCLHPVLRIFFAPEPARAVRQPSSIGRKIAGFLHVFVLRVEPFLWVFYHHIPDVVRLTRGSKNDMGIPGWKFCPHLHVDELGRPTYLPAPYASLPAPPAAPTCHAPTCQWLHTETCNTTQKIQPALLPQVHSTSLHGDLHTRHNAVLMPSAHLLKTNSTNAWQYTTCHRRDHESKATNAKAECSIMKWRCVPPAQHLYPLWDTMEHDRVLHWHDRSLYCLTCQCS